eukprot:TRINITY_DN5507_c0_g1_i1.p1 TRINITY_DN5507_c0_g1~~TRINITY_DN5507_c0_g1_i1.p1  ORF type:complete len:119 (-),score=22.29 TRINITY_DN5507_c0_g1_i1:130-486(-)
MGLSQARNASYLSELATLEERAEAALPPRIMKIRDLLRVVKMVYESDHRDFCMAFQYLEEDDETMSFGHYNEGTTTEEEEEGEEDEFLSQMQDVDAATNDGDDCDFASTSPSSQSQKR